MDTASFFPAKKNGNRMMIMMGRKFKRSMLEYSKMILSKINFDKKLFRKEYRKALKHLDSNEQDQLRQWVRSEGMMIQGY
jgi:hypothetical protein